MGYRSAATDKTIKADTDTCRFYQRVCGLHIVRGNPMRYCLLTLFLALAFAGCAPPHKYGKYKRWAAQQTLDIWKPGSIWVLVLLDRENMIQRTLTLRVTTDRLANSCIAGDWRQVEILAEYPPRDPSLEGEPAYSVKGAALSLELKANLCDNYYTLVGQLTESGLVGLHGPEGMFGGETVGRFYGAPVQP